MKNRKFRKRNLALTKVCVGEKSAVVPCVVAYETKHLINKFRLAVTDVDVEKPYYMDALQHQESYELVLIVKLSRTLVRRKFKNALKRTYTKLAKRYGWDLTIIEE